MSADEEIAALRRELDAAQVQLRERTQWKCACGGTDCDGQEENKRLRAEVESLRLGRLDDPLLAATVGPLRAEVERLRKESDVHVKIINDADRELEQAGIETENIIRQVPPAEGIRQLRARLAAAQLDKERMDWLENKGQIIARRYDDGWHLDANHSQWVCVNADTLRAAIDQAREANQSTAEVTQEEEK